jgi:hypothetical protein
VSWNKLLQLKNFFSHIRLRVFQDQKKKSVGHRTGNYLKEEEQENEEAGKNVKTHHR